MIERLKRLLAGPRVPWIAALVAALLVLPALFAGYMMDDFAHRVVFQDGFLPYPRHDWDLFNFQGPSRSELRTSLDLGSWPWWTPPTFRLAFFRPLSGLSHAFDYRVLGDHPALMHAENIALFAVLVLLAGFLYRRTIALPWVAGLAAMLFAVDDARCLVVCWIANRNALLSGVFGFGAMVLHDQWRRDRQGYARFLAPASFAVGLLCGETTVAALAYLFAYALFLDEAPRRERIQSLLPYGLLLAAFTAVYKGLGYGAHGGAYYIDPGGEPAAFAVAVVKRLPVLLLAQFAAPPAELWSQGPDAEVGPLFLAAAIVLALGFVLYRVLRDDRRSRFFATGMFLSLVPLCATWPNDRLLLFSGFGAFGLVATFLSRVGTVTGRGERLVAKGVSVLLVFFHAVAAPVLLPIRTASIGRVFHEYPLRGNASLPDDLGSTLVVLNAPDPLVASYAVGMRFGAGRPLPAHIRLLAVVVEGTETLERADDHTLVVTPSEGFFHDPFSQVFRSPSILFHTGDVVAVAGMRAEIGEINERGQPRSVRFHFDAPLDDAGFRWVVWKGTRFETVAPPKAGEKLVLPGIDYLKAVFGEPR